MEQARLTDRADVAAAADEVLLACRTLRPPDVAGRSKRLWHLPDAYCVVELIPSLRSFTHTREALVEDTDVLRMDFYELAARVLRERGVRTAFVRRLSATAYLAQYHPAPPFEVVVKNRAVGSTQVKYPGLFPDGVRLPRPVVKLRPGLPG